jgi:hypothetical protein
MQVWQRAGQTMHQAAQQQQAAAAAGGGAETSTPEAGAADGDEDVVEGEIVDEGGGS